MLLLKKNKNYIIKKNKELKKFFNFLNFGDIIYLKYFYYFKKERKIFKLCGLCINKKSNYFFSLRSLFNKKINLTLTFFLFDPYIVELLKITKLNLKKIRRLYFKKKFLFKNYTQLFNIIMKIDYNYNFYIDFLVKSLINMIFFNNNIFYFRTFINENYFIKKNIFLSKKFLRFKQQYF